VSKCKVLAAVIVLGLSTGVEAQMPSAVGEPVEAIGVVADGGLPGTGVNKKLLTVPPGQVFRLTDLSLVTRRADTGPSACIVEIHRGTESGPTSLAWTRVKLLNSETYDRTWQTAPSFGPGEVVWVKAFFDPFNTGLRICVRLIPNFEAEIHYALRGYLSRGN